MPDFNHSVDYVAWYSANNFSSVDPLGDLAYAKCDVLPELDVELTRELAIAASGPWAESEFPELNKFLDLNDASIDAFQAATNLENVRWDLSPIREQGMFELPGPPLTGFRILGRAILARAWRMVSGPNSKSNPLIDAIQSNLRCADHLDRRFGTGPCLYAMQLRSIALRGIRKAIELDALNEEQLRNVLSMVLRCSAPSPGEAICAEAAMFYDFLQRIYPNKKFSMTAARNLGKGQYFPASGVFLPSPEETAEKAKEYYQPIVVCANRELSLACLREMEKLQQRKDKLAEGNNLLKLNLPALGPFYRLAVANEMERRGTAVVLAITIYLKESRKFPGTLEELYDIVPASICLDPYSTNEFVYRVEDNNVHLYSLGIDGVDDGGKHESRAYRNMDCDYVFLPQPKE